MTKKNLTRTPFSDNKNIENLKPDTSCHKCGRKLWYIESQPLTWSCASCGNLLYYTYGSFRQQIDIAMQCRKSEYVYTPGGNCIVPKKSEEHRKSRFYNKIRKKKEVKA